MEKKAYLEVAHTISRFEPVTMMVSKTQFSATQQILAPEVRVVEMAKDDAWSPVQTGIWHKPMTKTIHST